jgi:hypothetical protein
LGVVETGIFLQRGLDGKQPDGQIIDLAAWMGLQCSLGAIIPIKIVTTGLTQ